MFLILFSQIFSIVAFATTSGFSVALDGNCNDNTIPKPHAIYEYPFIISDSDVCHKHQIILNVSSDCQFFVATGVLSFLYCILIIFVYVVKDELYQTRQVLPKADFVITLILAVFWLSGSAAWSNGTSQLKFVTDVNVLKKACETCTFTIGSFSKLNISLVIFLKYEHSKNKFISFSSHFPDCWISEFLPLGIESLVHLQRNCMVPKAVINVNYYYSIIVYCPFVYRNGCK